jgi:hypothetical protein
VVLPFAQYEANRCKGPLANRALHVTLTAEGLAIGCASITRTSGVSITIASYSMLRHVLDQTADACNLRTQVYYACELRMSTVGICTPYHVCHPVSNFHSDERVRRSEIGYEFSKKWLKELEVDGKFPDLAVRKGGKGVA